MSKTKQVFSVLMIVALLLAACEPGDLPDDPAAVATALIATATQVANLISTDTPVPPTATPALPADTSVPAATSTPLPESTQPSSPPTDTPAPPT
ncbi:MAG: hypothetical protein AAB658_04260, partial [Chloroflexota bacterium]